MTKQDSNSIFEVIEESLVLSERMIGVVRQNMGRVRKLMDLAMDGRDLPETAATKAATDPPEDCHDQEREDS